MSSDCEKDNNASLQADEIEALSSIYGEEWKAEDLDNKVYSINIGCDPTRTVHFEVTLPLLYPLESPPVYQFSAPWMSREAKNRLSAEIESYYCEHVGESILYAWVEKIRDFLDTYQSGNTSDAPDHEDCDPDVVHILEKDFALLSAAEVDELPEIEHGEPITDRRSVFQAHVAPVFCVEQVKQVLSKLKENRKIALATHNVYAYRIFNDANGTFYQDCEDDGENRAGSLLLHLLQILDVHNVLVVVTRWYGGIHLGPDRFKHINNAARTLLDQCGYIKQQKSNHEKPKKKR